MVSKYPIRLKLENISTNFSIASLSRLALGGISLVVVGFLTRYLGPDGFGDYSAILAYLFLFTILADLGLYTVLTREISKPGADQPKIAGNIFTIRLTVVLLSAVLANLAVFLLPYSGTVRLGILIASGFMILSSLGQALMGIFQKHLKIYLVSVSDLIARSAQLGLVVFLIFIKAPFLYFVSAITVSEIIHFGFIFYFARKLVRFRLLFDRTYWRKIFKISVPIAASLVFVLLYFKMDTFLISLFKPPGDVGVYSVAFKILEAIIFFPAMYIGLVMPLLSKYAASDRKKFGEIFRNAFDRLALFGFPVLFFILAAASPLVGLLGGGAFAESSTVLLILSVATLAIFFGNLGGHALIALNLQKKGMWIYLSGAIFNLTGNLALIPKYSYLAAAWTTVATEIMVTAAMFWVIKKTAGHTARCGVFLKSLTAAVLMWAVLYHIKSESLLILIPAALVYWPLIYLMGGINKNDIGTLFNRKNRPPALY